MKQDADNTMPVEEFEAMEARVKELEARERGFMKSLNHVADGMIIADAEGRVRRMNPAAEALTGWKETDASGRRVDDVFRIDDDPARASTESPVAHALREGVVVELPDHALLANHDGIVTPVAGNVSPIRDGRGAVSGLALVFRGRTEEPRAREHETRLRLMTRALRNINRLIQAEMEPGRLIERICANLTGTTVCSNAWIALTDKNGGAVTMAASSGFEGGEPMRERLKRREFSTLMKQALEKDELVVVMEPSGRSPGRASAHDHRERAWMTRRLARGGAIRGVFSMSVPASLALDPEARELFTEAAGSLAFALHGIESKKRREAAEKEVVDTLESISDAFFALDDDMVLTYFNRAAERLLGRSADDVVGKPLFDAFPEARGSIFEKEYTRAIREKRATTFETWFDVAPYRNWYDVRVYPRENGISVYFLVTTKRKRAEATLRESEERYRAVSELTSDFAYSYRIESDGELVNEWTTGALTRSTGYSRRELRTIGGWDRLVHPGDLSIPLGQLRELLSNRASTVEYRILTRDGRVRWMRDHARPVWSETENRVARIEGAVRDVTERRNAREALHLSLKKYEKTFRSVPVWVVLSSLETGRYLEVNDAYLKTMGSEWEEVIGKTSIELGTWVDPRVREYIASEVRKKGGVRDLEVQRKTRSGKIIDTLFSAERLTLRGERLMISVTRDITNRKRAEKEKARMEEQFHQMQKMESIGRLAGGVAHDLNNLLSPILGYGEILLEDAVGDEARSEQLKQIVQAGARARDLVHRLLAFGRKQIIQFKPVDLNALLKHFEKLLRRAIREDVAIHMNLARPLPAVSGDVGQLEQVVMNLVVNAQDAMPDGGRLTIETARVELDESYTKRRPEVMPGAYVALIVSDTGRGMDKATRERIFEPFFTTKGVGEGSGLGLSTAYGIVKQHGGNIWAYSEPGLGTTFKVYLPESTKSTEDVEPAPPPPTNLSGSETILLVEDDEQVKNLAFVMLKRQGYNVLVAESGKEALSILERHNEPVHLLLTDVVMPEMNGKELFERISQRYPEIKALYMSGYNEDVIAHHGVMDEGVHFMQKPFSIKLLAARIREVLDLA